MFYVNCCQQEIQPEKYFNNKNRMTHSVMLLSFSSTCCHISWTGEQNGLGSSDGVYAWAD